MVTSKSNRRFGRTFKIASKLIKQTVLNIKFQEMEFEYEFDGIWASASLLHIARTEIYDVLNRMANSLKEYGIFYASFKYGVEEYEKAGRYFNCHDEASITKLFKSNEKLNLLKSWITNDTRINRTHEFWLNCLVKNDN
jgi:hypothetical protein